MAQPQQRPPGSVVSPLDSLQGTMNLILQIVGGVLSDPVKRKDPQSRQKIAQVLPVATERFQEALDRIEDDIMRAQAVMRRDLMLSRANKAFEEAEEAEANAQPIIVEKVEEAQSVANGTAKDAVDLTMSDEPIVIEDTPPKLQQKAKEVVVKTEPTTVETAPTTMAEDTTAKTPTTTGDTKADDFDAIFGDFAETSPTNNNDTSIDMNDFPDSSADVSSLLPGLENYASMPDPSTSTPDLSANMPDLSASMPENRVPEALTTTNNMSSLDSGGLDFNMLGIPGQEENQDQKVKVGQSDKQAGDGEVTNYDNDNSFDDLFDMSYMDNNVENNQDMEDWMASLN